MKINSMPEGTSAKDSGKIIYSPDGVHMQQMTRQTFLRGYGGGSKGGDGGLQYFTETEHALTGSVRYNGLSDVTLDDTSFEGQYENEWFDQHGVPQDFNWGRINGAVTGVAYTYGVIDTPTPQVLHTGEVGNEGHMPSESDYIYSVLGGTNRHLQAFDYIFKKTNPGLTYFANVYLPPRWTDYVEGSTHSNAFSQNTDWDHWTIMFCETEQPTYELYKRVEATPRDIAFDDPLPPEYPPGDGEFSQAVIDAITTYLDSDDDDIEDLLIDVIAPTHSSGRYSVGKLTHPGPNTGRYVIHEGSGYFDDTSRPKQDSDVGAMTSPASYFALTDTTKWEVVASGNGIATAIDFGFPATCGTISLRGKQYYVSYLKNAPRYSIKGASSGYNEGNQGGHTASYSVGHAGYGDTNSFIIPSNARLPYRGGAYKADGNYSYISYGAAAGGDPDKEAQLDFGAESIIYAAAEAVLPCTYYSGIKRNDNTALFVGAWDADGNNPAATVDIAGNSTFNGGGGGGGSTPANALSDATLDGVSIKNGTTAALLSGTGGVQRYLLKENRVSWDPVNLRWNTELVALPEVGDNSGDRYIPAPTAEFVGMNWNPFFVSGLDTLRLGSFAYKDDNNAGGAKEMALKLGSHLTFDNTSQVLDATGFYDGVEDIPVDGLWIKRKSVQGGYELGFGALFSYNDFDVRTVGSGASAYPYIELSHPPVVYTAGAGINITNGVISVTTSGVYVQNKQNNCYIVPKGASSSTYTIAGIYPGGNMKPTGSIDIFGTWEIDAIVKIYTNQYQPATDDECIVLWLGNNYCSGVDIDNQSYSHFDRPMTKIMLKDYVNDSYIYAHIHGIIENGTNAPIWVLGHNESLLNSQGGGTYAVLTGVTVAIRAYKIGTEESGISE